MAKSLNQLLLEADSIIEKRAQENATRSVVSSDDDDSVEKYASMLLAPVAQPATQAPAGETAVRTLNEKIAHSLFLVEQLVNIKQAAQLQQFEDVAREKGYSEEKIAEYTEKLASKLPYKSILPALGLAAATGAGSAYVGHKAGKSKGSKEGYTQAIQDVDQAMREYQL